jgi:protein TonB
VIAAAPHRSGSHKGAHVQGWIVSVLLHSTVALAAILFVKQVQLAPQDEAFKWNVAMVSPTQHVQSTVSTRSRISAQSTLSTTSASPPPAPQAAPTQTFSSPQLLAQQPTLPISNQTATPVPTESPVPAPTQPAEPVKHETVTPIAAESTSIIKPTETPMSVSAESVAQTPPSNGSSAIFEQTVPSDQEPTKMAAISPAPSNSPMKRDYGWLSEAVIRRVEELKRYPASARVDPAEGKVVLTVVINEDGSVGDVEVFQSSGHAALDKAAVETIRQAAPFHLPRPLGKAYKTLKIPMNYHFDG